MVLIDPGLDNGMEFGHTDYKTGEGRYVTRSENRLERGKINPKLSNYERARISRRDGHRRNLYCISLHHENNTRILGHISYNPINENLSFSWTIAGHHGKKLVRLN